MENKNIGKFNWGDKRVLVTGGTGFLGSHIVSKLKKRHPKKLKVVSSKNADLRKFDQCLKVSKNVDLLIHLAANVGGIGYNKEKPADLFDDNILMGVNMMRAARINGVKKYLALGTVCAYPKFTPIPFKEKDLWMGYPEETNAPYGLAKKMQLVQGQAYRDQYGFNVIFLIPVNLYGPGDSFDPNRSHVIPALIKKFVDAKENNENEVVVWGTGKVTREFLYVEDAADGIISAMEKYDKADPINLGSGVEISIKNLAGLIKKITGYKGKIVWDKSKPDGQPRRMLDTSKAQEEFEFKAHTKLEDGLIKTVDWYLKNKTI